VSPLLTGATSGLGWISHNRDGGSSSKRKVPCPLNNLIIQFLAEFFAGKWITALTPQLRKTCKLRLKPLIRKTQFYIKRIAHKGVWVEPGELLTKIECMCGPTVYFCRLAWKTTANACWC
jgi:hypothetical protein